MDVAKITEVLKEEYGINSREELAAAMSEMRGIDIGIFTLPLFGRREESEQEIKAMAPT